MKDFKIAVRNKEHREAIQKRLFKLGYKWKNSGDVIIDHILMMYIYVRENGMIYSGIHDTYPELELLTLDDLYTLSPNKVLEVDTLGYKIVLDDNGLQVGCQSISLADTKKIKDFLNENLKE